MITLYGIPNCDTVKKARTWLHTQGYEVEWVDFKKTPPTLTQLQHWCDHIGWEALLNKKSTTWRGLDEQIKQATTDTITACAVMHDHPSLIKRPILCRDDQIIALGFNVDQWLNLLSQ